MNTPHAARPTMKTLNPRRILAALILLPLASACATVKPWQRLVHRGAGGRYQVIRADVLPDRVAREADRLAFKARCSGLAPFLNVIVRVSRTRVRSSLL